MYASESLLYAVVDWCSVYSTELPMQTVTLRLLCLAVPCKPAAQQKACELLLVIAPVSSHPWASCTTLLVWTLVVQVQAATSEAACQWVSVA